MCSLPPNYGAPEIINEMFGGRSEELLKIQPLSAPSNMSYYLNYVYGDGTIILKKRNYKSKIIIL